MPILQTGMNKRRGAFTLIELVIVIFIISLTTALIMPRFWDRGEGVLMSEAKRLSNSLRHVYDESVGKKKTYLLRIDLDGDTWGFESDKESRTFELKDDVTFTDIVVPSLGEVSAGEVTIPFGPMGPEEPIILHFMKNELEFTVIFNHISGRAKVHEKYTI